MMSDTQQQPRHIIAIIGGAVAGAEAARVFSLSGVETVVIDQNTLPYGKLEDGLPKWHGKLRDKEEDNIDIKLNHPLVHFVPGVTVSRDISFVDLHQLGFSAVLIATGAWKDRSVPVDGIDEFINKGLWYQNDFIWRFNHCHEPGFMDALPDIPDGAMVIGGGLASLDIVKVIMLETVKKALEKKGIAVDILSLERSIPAFLSKHGLTLESLSLNGCTLYYRKRCCDMPLTPVSNEDTGKREKVRLKILANFMEKYLFRVKDCMVPVDKIVINEFLAGIVFRMTRFENGLLSEIPGSEVRAESAMIISSIGSVPAPIEGLPYRKEMFDLADMDTCRIEGLDNVFTAGNAVTGRGNIIESMKHGRRIAEYMLNHFLPSSPTLPSEKISEISEWVKALQLNAGYNGNFTDWIKKYKPVRLENILKEKK
ncbi:MAG: FAD-dependent oxidoreductase [Bacteroidetes bacterium]|nr:FAD-dependent oxidoreductase [Bacteroidota bacterium]